MGLHDVPSPVSLPHHPACVSTSQINYYLNHMTLPMADLLCCMFKKWMQLYKTETKIYTQIPASGSAKRSAKYILHTLSKNCPLELPPSPLCSGSMGGNCWTKFRGMISWELERPSVPPLVPQERWGKQHRGCFKLGICSTQIAHITVGSVATKWGNREIRKCRDWKCDEMFGSWNPGCGVKICRKEYLYELRTVTVKVPGSCLAWSQASVLENLIPRRGRGRALGI